MIERCWIASAAQLAPTVLYDQASADWYRERNWAVTEMVPADQPAGAVWLTEGQRNRLLDLLSRPVPPGPLKKLDEAIITKLTERR